MSASWETLVSWISRHWLLERLFLASLEFAVLTVVAAIVLSLLKPRTPRLVALAWAIVLAKPLFSLLIGSPIHLIRLPAPEMQTAIALTSDDGRDSSNSVKPNLAYSPADGGGAIVVGPNRQRVSDSSEVNLVAGPQFVEPAAGQVDDAPVVSLRTGRQTSEDSWDWQLSVMALWLCGVVFMLIRALIVRRQLADILDNGRTPEQQVHDLYLQAAAATNVRQPPRLLVTDTLESPALVGLRRTTILIPEWLAVSAKNSVLTWALRHELCHWKCGDLWLIRLREVVRMLFYFHPAAWWAGKRLEVALEIACDRSVIANEAEAADYAQRLYEILDAVRHRRRQPLAGGLFATRSQIALRLAMLVESPLRLRPGLTKTAALAISLLAVIVLTAGSGFHADVNAQDDIVVDRVDKTVGTVIDEKSRPVADASIRFLTTAAKPATTTSDANGRFWFSEQPEKHGTLVASDVNGKRMGYANWYPQSERVPAPQIVLKPVREVIVKVVDARGAPVAGASYASPGARYDLDDLVLTGKTGDDGTATLRFSDDARAYQVIAFKSGVGFDSFVSPRRPDQEVHERLPGEITLTLDGARTLTIKAVGQKQQPVEGVRFSLDSYKKREGGDSVFLYNCDAVHIATDASGTAVFDWLPESFADSLRFECDSLEYAVRVPRRASIDFLWLRHDDPAKEWTVPVLRRTALSGKVVDQDGKPRQGIVIRASGIGADRNTGRGETITDAQGAYRMMVTSEQSYLVGVVDDHWAAPTRTGVVVRENVPVNGIDFKLDEGTVLRGAVIDQTGRALANRQVVLLLEGKQIPAEIRLPSSQRIGDRRLYHHRMSRSDERGQFQFRVASGTYKLAASEMGAVSLQTPQADVTIDAQREVVQDLRVQVEKTVRLKGSVVDPDGKPVAEQQVFGFYLLPRLTTEDISLSAKTGADGSFEIDRKVFPAILHVRIEDRKLGGLARIDPDQNEVAIQLRPLVVAHGRFADEKGQGVAGRRLQSGVSNLGVLLSVATTDSNGRFTLVGLLPGEEHTIQLFEGNPMRLVPLTSITIKEPGPVELGDLRLPPIPNQEALTLKGKVVGSDGKPVAGADVRAVFLQPPTRVTRRSAQAKTSAEGTFEFKRPAVPAVLSLRTADHMLGGIVRIDDRQTEVSMKAAPLGKARGILTDRSGKALAGATITSTIIIRATPGYSVGILGVSATTAADGSYTLEGLLPNETYTVRHVEISDGKAGRSTEIKTIKLEKAETVELGKTPLP